MKEFVKKGWYYIPNIISKEEALEIKYKNLCGAVRELGNLKGHHDPERGRVLTCYAPPTCTYIMWRIKPILEELLGEELLPTYWFSTTYHNRGWMNCHTDRPSCEVSVTMNICGDSDWPIKLKDLEGKKQSFITPVGHGVAYLGTQVEHWRSPLRTHTNDRFMQLFLHFVRKNGQYTDYAFDRSDKCYQLLNLTQPN
jgi:hypothetical protein